jgi:hypothetical protein
LSFRYPLSLFLKLVLVSHPNIVQTLFILLALILQPFQFSLLSLIYFEHPSLNHDIPPLPQYAYAFMAWCSVKAQGQLYLYLKFWCYL